MPRDALFGGLLDRLSDGRGVWVMVVEDLHWADDTTLDLLRFLARRIADVAGADRGQLPRRRGRSRSTRCGCCSATWPTSPTVRRLPLRPLSLDAVTAMVAGGSRIDAEHLYATTGGNPFYVTEVIAAGGDEIPPTVRDAVLARAARLSAPARQVLDAAAVVTPPVETWLLAEVAGSTPEHLDECVAAGMLRGAPRRGRVPARAGPAGRRARGAARPAWPNCTGARSPRCWPAPTAPTTPTRLAHHAEGAGDAAAVLAYASARPDAGRPRSGRTAPRPSSTTARCASPPGCRSAELADLLERHSYECYLTSRFDDAAASRERALACWRAARRPAPAGRRAALAVPARVVPRRDRPRPSGLRPRRRSPCSRTLPPGPELAMAYSNLAQLRMLAGDAAATIHWGQLAIDLAERLDRTDILAHALNNVGTVEVVPPIRRTAGQAPAQPRPGARPTQHRGTCRPGVQQPRHDRRRHARRSPSADRWLERGHRLLRRARPRLLAVCRCSRWRARLDMDRGAWAAALAADRRGPARSPHRRRSRGSARSARLAGSAPAAASPDVWPVLEEALGAVGRHRRVRRAR